MDEIELIEQIRKHNQPLEPRKTELEPRRPELSSIRAVVFDIYGTLLISGTGDISLACTDNHNQALLKTFEDFNVGVTVASAPFADQFTQLILQAQESRRADHVDYPEIDILQVWKYLLIEAVESGWIDRYPREDERRLMAVDFECRVNPVAAMPGLEETLRALKSAGKTLGIVSNAQFFTPLLFPALLGKDLDALGFDANCRIWSWILREAKPSQRLYKELARQLKDHHGIQPAEALFVGNDLRNDIAPAQACGFKTALFAGDQRSLRIREGDPLVKDVEPDGILTDLRQLIAQTGPLRPTEA